MKRQQYTSDLSKKAKKRLNTNWGGRWADGYQDEKVPRSFWNYKNKTLRKTGKGKNKIIYHYPTSYKKLKWSSYGKKY